jgi:predicted DNA-binding transcriptional regulator YafY
MVAWCETRQDFRHFRADRMSALNATDTRYPRRRQALLKEWRVTLDVPKRQTDA